MRDYRVANQWRKSAACGNRLPLSWSSEPEMLETQKKWQALASKFGVSNIVFIFVSLSDTCIK